MTAKITIDRAVLEQARLGHKVKMLVEVECEACAFSLDDPESVQWFVHEVPPYPGDEGVSSQPDTANIYRAMLNAAPEAPQPAKRGPLTDEEINDLADATPVDEIIGPDTWHIRLARAIEAAHGITEEADR